MSICVDSVTSVINIFCQLLLCLHYTLCFISIQHPLFLYSKIPSICFCLSLFYFSFLSPPARFLCIWINELIHPPQFEFLWHLVASVLTTYYSSVLKNLRLQVADPTKVCTMWQPKHGQRVNVHMLWAPVGASSHAPSVQHEQSVHSP